MSGSDSRKDQIFGQSRGQLITWVAVAVVILLVGGNYLRGQLSGSATGAVLARTTTISASADVDDDAAALIKVHVAGAVAAPGMYELEEGDRVADALKQAGGALPDADIDLINLAAKLMDGQQVFVSREGEAPPATGPVTASGSGGSLSGGNQVINLNTATAEQLQQLDGVGEKTAQKIVAYREEHGAFGSIEELMEVPGIGPSKFEGIKDSVSV